MVVKLVKPAVLTLKMELTPEEERETYMAVLSLLSAKP